MSKDEVKNLFKDENDIDKCLNDDNTEKCSQRFICLDDTCQSVNKTSTYMEFPDKNGVNKQYIAEYCFPDKLKWIDGEEGCTTEKCTADTDCISNKCTNGVCVLSKSTPFTECSVKKVKYLGIYSYRKMYCGPLGFEKHIEAWVLLGIGIFLLICCCGLCLGCCLCCGNCCNSFFHRGTPKGTPNSKV